MKRIYFFNEYEIRGDVTALFLYPTDGKRYETLIDTSDLEYVKSLDLYWNLRRDVNTNGFYARSTERYLGEDGKMHGRSRYLHVELINPEHNPDVYVDHRDHDGLNNRRKNLRRSENKENTKHRKAKNSNNTSGYRNVMLDKQSGLWMVRLQVNKKAKTLGKFEDVHEAGEYAEQMRQKYYGKYAGTS